MLVDIIFLAISFILSALLGKVFIPLLKKLKVGQNERNDGPRAHLRKQGTPTMGGIWILITIVAISIIYMLLKVIPSSPLNNGDNSWKIIFSVLIATIGFGLVGFIDDYKKVIKKNTDGLSPMKKMFGLGIISVIYAVLLIRFLGTGTDIVIPFAKISVNLSLWFYLIFIIFVMLGTTNAVNLTDGVDGLAGSVVTIISATFAVISFRYNESSISVYSAICMGAVFGFLIYNFYKAKVMMGDTGSLLLGGMLSSIAIYLKLPLILILVAIIPVIETLSVMIQVFSGKFFGKLVFKMTPLHHHFELSGWRETKVVGVFAFITFVACLISIFVV